MTVGAKDYIDKLLVEKYAQKQVDNHESNSLESKVDANDMLEAMNSAAYSYRNVLAVTNRLTMICYGINAKNAIYPPAEEVA